MYKQKNLSQSVAVIIAFVEALSQIIKIALPYLGKKLTQKDKEKIYKVATEVEDRLNNEGFLVSKIEAGKIIAKHWGANSDTINRIVNYWEFTHWKESSIPVCKVDAGRLIRCRNLKKGTSFYQPPDYRLFELCLSYPNKEGYGWEGLEPRCYHLVFPFRKLKKGGNGSGKDKKNSSIFPLILIAGIIHYL